MITLEFIWVLLAEVMVSSLFLWLRYFFSYYRGLAMANYTYMRAPWYATAASVVAAGTVRKYEGGVAWGNVTLTDSWVITEHIGLVHFTQASIRDATASWCKIHMESILGEGWYKGKIAPSAMAPTKEWIEKGGLFKIEII